MLFVLILLWAGPVQAQEGLYDLSAVDYFRLKGQNKTDLPSLWIEEEHMPAPVIALLDDPDEATARRYLEWNRERLARVARAQQIVDDVQRMTSSGDKP